MSTSTASFSASTLTASHERGWLQFLYGPPFAKEDRQDYVNSDLAEGRCMARRFAFIFAFIFAFGTCAALASISINAQGTFRDLGVWLYESPNHTYGFGPATIGTNERLDMPPPSPPAGGVVAGIEIISHPLDTLGYPLHISLIDKLYATQLHIDIDVSDNGTLWSWHPGNAVGQESMIDDGSTTTTATLGPIPAAGPIPTPYQAAFNFALQALASISNMPDSQKQLANYAVLFVPTTTITWVELAPAFGPGEPQHLGCQTNLGRDMVFGFRQGSSAGSGGVFLQCF